MSRKSCSTFSIFRHRIYPMSHEDMLQFLDVERVLIDQMIPFDRDALLEAKEHCNTAIVETGGRRRWVLKSKRRPRASMIRESGGGCCVSAARTRRCSTMNRPIAARSGADAAASARYAWNPCGRSGVACGCCLALAGFGAARPCSAIWRAPVWLMHRFACVPTQDSDHAG